MTKPTGRPKGRPKGPEYLTLTARMPLELVEQVRRYAGRKRQPLSEVLRDGLLLLLEQEDTAPRYAYDRKAAPVQAPDIPSKVSDIKEDTALARKAPVVHQASKVPDIKGALLPPGTPRAVIVSDIKEESDSTYGKSLAPQPDNVSDIKEAVSVPLFDTIKYRLGKLCPRGHDYHGAGQSLRVNNKAGYCLACNAAMNQRKRDHKRQEVSA